MSNSEIRRLAAEIAGIKREIRASSTTQQLANSTVENGVISVVDASGREMMTVGQSPDGSYGANVRNGPKPPTPSVPVMIPTPSGMTVRWDGTWTDSLMSPDDFTRIEVHLSESADLSAESVADMVGTVESPRGGDVVVTKLKPQTTYYARLVARNTAGGRGDASAVASGVSLAPQDGPGTAQAREDAQRASEAARKAQERADALTQAHDAMKADVVKAGQDAITAQNKADTAMSTANGKNTIYWSTIDPPNVEPKVTGDIYFVRDVDASYKIIKQYRAVDNVWQPMVITDTVIANLSAGKITSGTLDVGTIIQIGSKFASDGLATPYMEIGRSAIQIYRPNDADSVDETTGQVVPHEVTFSVGGTDTDRMLIKDITGQWRGFDPSGNCTVNRLIADDLEIGGRRLGDSSDNTDTLWQFPKGFIAGYRIPENSVEIGTNQCGIAELSMDTEPGRLYRVYFDGNMLSSAPGAYRLFLRVTSDGSAPTINSTQLSMGIFSTHLAGFRRNHIEAYFWAGYNNVRVLLSAQMINGAGTVSHYWDGRSYFVCEDVGPLPESADDTWTSGMMTLGGGSAASAGTATTTTSPTATRKTYTKTYSATWSGSYNGSGNAMGTSVLRQGYSGSYGQMKGAIGFPSQIQSDLAGAKILKMELYVYAYHWYNDNGGTLNIGAHTSRTSTSTFPGSTQVVTTKKWSTKSGGQWITIPSTQFPFWESGNNKGFTVGVGASNSNAYYAKLNGYNMANPPKLKITYVK